MQTHLTLATLPSGAPASGHSAAGAAPRATVSPVAAVVGNSGAVFDFDDLQALRDEYEERIRKLERERTAQIDVLERDHAQRIAVEAESRQELIHELTYELAAAREEGEQRARDAERRTHAITETLRTTLARISELEAGAAALRQSIEAALAVPAPVAYEAPLVATATPRTSVTVPVWSAAQAGAEAIRKRKIRLR
jgi:hypothetical protein